MDDHMDMLMMMQMDKLPDFCGPYNEVVSPAMEFTNTNTTPMLPNFDNPLGVSPTFMNLPPTISFSRTQPLAMAEPPFLSSTNSFSTQSSAAKRSSMAAMREMIFRIAAMQPIHIDPESVKPPKRRNVKISKDPQSVAARHRRERISERIRILQRLVPGGTKMDTASMLDEAIHYVKFLKTQVQSLERAAVNRPATGIGFPVAMSNGSYLPVNKEYQPAQSVQHYADV